MRNVKRLGFYKEVVLHAVVIAFLVVTVFPIFWMLFSSIKPTSLVFANPPVWVFTPTLENYRQALGLGVRGWGAGMPQYFVNSLIIASVVTISNVAVGALGGYGLARLRGGDLLSLLFLLAKMLPPTVLILPFFLIVRRLGLSDTHLGLILVYTALNLPFCVWMARGYFLDLPREIEEAAMIDGCSRLRSLLAIVAPLAFPGLVAIAILVFVFSWNEFMFGMILTSQKARTLPVAASLFITDEAILWGPMTATAVLIMVVPMLITLVAQKYIVGGLISGSLKG